MMLRTAIVTVVWAVTLGAQPPSPDTFMFRDGGSRLVNVTLAREAAGMVMTWPGDAGDWDTALLGVTVASGLPDAFVEIAAAGRSDRQYFSAEDAGPRWLNLSFLRGAVPAGARVSVHANGLQLSDGVAPMRLFSNNLDLSRTILVLAPHPDDAEIAAFGLYADRNATIVTVTAGNAGPRSYEAVFDNDAEMYHFKGRIRLIDSITVPWQGGIPPARAFNLGYFDARLAAMHDQPAAVIPEMYGPNTDIGAYLRYNLGSLLPKRPRASTWTNLVDDLDAIVRKVKPAVILAPHPQLDSHADHQFTTVALEQALARRRRRATLLLYTNHADRNRYPYGPAGTIMSLPPPVAQRVPIDRVYSHPVPADRQRRKLFALESMHDLRSSPSRLYQAEIGPDRMRSPELPGPSAVGGVNYLRRAPRSNELFFVYDETTVKPVLAAFLDARRAAAAR
jgi:LmbE family N-acetylglucosaminyl deacetylase